MEPVRGADAGAEAKAAAGAVAFLAETEALAKAEAEVADTRTGSDRENCPECSSGLLWSYIVGSEALRGRPPQRG